MTDVNVNPNSSDVADITLIRFKNKQKRDSSKDKVPTTSKTSDTGFIMLHPLTNPAEFYSDSLHLTFEVSDDTQTPWDSISKSRLLAMSKVESAQKVQIDVDGDYTLLKPPKDGNWTYFDEKDIKTGKLTGKRLVIATYGLPSAQRSGGITCSIA